MAKRRSRHHKKGTALFGFGFLDEVKQYTGHRTPTKREAHKAAVVLRAVPGSKKAGRQHPKHLAFGKSKRAMRAAAKKGHSRKVGGARRRLKNGRFAKR